ncbi:MAG: adenosylcobinamide-GDP ribazoletransferase, partial [Micromonosporaceae bacterium]|nr:adenosylcobinamide-GDP ribazoletransferase [Micromonosporaceae bacterium]
DGLAALVAGTAGWPALLPGTAGLLAVSVAAVPGRPWQGPVAVAVAVVASQLLLRHAVRRLAGITGDVLGACVEVAGCVAYAAVALG